MLQSQFNANSPSGRWYFGEGDHKFQVTVSTRLANTCNCRVAFLSGLAVIYVVFACQLLYLDYARTVNVHTFISDVMIEYRNKRLRRHAWQLGSIGKFQYSTVK